MIHVRLAAFLACLGLVACATKRLPPGTPPPEYETRAVSPWPPVTPSSSVAPVPVATGPDAPPEPATSLDAGSVSPSPSPDAGSE
jgi:hypothetical protein